MEGHRQDRPHPHAGRDAAHAGPGMVRLRRHARRRSRADRGRAEGRVSAGARRHRGRHRHQRGARLCRSGGGGDREAHRAAVRQRTEQVHRAGRARCAGAAVRHTAHAGRIALQDRQRHPPDVVRPARRLRRVEDPGERAGLVDHAGQGEPDPGRGADDDRRAGDGQRRGGRLRRRRRLPGDERLQAADDLQHHALDHDPDRRLHELPQVPGRGHQAESEEDQGICGPLADAGDGALAGHRLRQGVEDCALRDGQRPDAEGGRAEARLRDGRGVRPRRRSGEDGPAVRSRRTDRSIAGISNTETREEAMSASNTGTTNEASTFCTTPGSTSPPPLPRRSGRRSAWSGWFPT